MALLCDKVEMHGAQIWCKVTDMPCGHQRYCAVSMKYYQTDNAKKCTLRRKENEQRTQ